MAVTDYQNVLQTVDASIAINTSLSAAVDLGGCRLVGIAMPAAWTAANLTFQGSADGSTYNNLHDDSGNEVTVTAAASRHIVFDTTENFAGVRWLKVRSGTSGAAVNQAGARTVTLVAKPQ